MLVAAFGISEFEFAKLKDKGRERFNEYFRARFEYLDTEKYIEEFFNIATALQNAPDTMFSTKEISVQYAKMYNLAMKILNDRILYEQNNANEKQKKQINLKSNYAKYKIVNTLKQAKRNQCLESKAMNEIIIDNKPIKKYTRISKILQYRFRKVANQIYSSKDTIFDNTELILTIINELKFPMLGKLYKIFNKKDNLLLEQGFDDGELIYNFNEELEERKKLLNKESIVIPNKEIFELNEKIITTENKY